MTWGDTAGTIVTGAIGLAIGVIVAGKVIKDATSIKSHDGSESEINERWRLNKNESILCKM